MDITRYVEKYRDEKDWLYRMRGPDRAKKNCRSYRGDVKGGRPEKTTDRSFFIQSRKADLKLGRGSISHDNQRAGIAKERAHGTKHEGLQNLL